MSKTLQEQVYDYVVTTLNLTTTPLMFRAGYHISLNKGIYRVIDDSGSLFNYKVKEVIPVTEEYANETPSVNKADRADFATSYQFVYRIKDNNLNDVRTALAEYRAYMLANKDVVIDGYNISFKTTRGDKYPDSLQEDGSFYGRYIIKVYFTAVKYGHLSTNSDKWEMKLYGGATYEELTTTQDTSATSCNTQPSIKSNKIIHFNTASSFTTRINVIYNPSSPMSLLLYRFCMNKQASLNQWYSLKETFNSIVSEYTVIITSASRTRMPSGLIIMEIGIAEVL